MRVPKPSLVVNPSELIRTGSVASTCFQAASSVSEPVRSVGQVHVVSQGGGGAAKREGRHGAQAPWHQGRHRRWRGEPTPDVLLTTRIHRWRRPLGAGSSDPQVTLPAIRSVGRPGEAQTCGHARVHGKCRGTRGATEGGGGSPPLTCFSQHEYIDGGALLGRGPRTRRSLCPPSGRWGGPAVARARCSGSVELRRAPGHSARGPKLFRRVLSLDPL